MTSNEILVIHDDIEVAEEIRRIVSSSGFKTHLAKNKTQALEISSVTTLRSIIINALLADVSIVALITEIRKIPHLKETPIILLAESDGVYNEILALSRDTAAYGTINSIKLPATEEDLVALINSSEKSSDNESDFSNDLINSSLEIADNDNVHENWNAIDLSMDQDKSKIESEDDIEINALKIEDEQFIEDKTQPTSKDNEILQEEDKPDGFMSEEKPFNAEILEEFDSKPQIEPEAGISETEQYSNPSPQVIKDTVPFDKKLFERPNLPESIEKTFDSDQLRLPIDDSMRPSSLFKDKRVLYIGVIQIIFVIVAAFGAYMFLFKDNAKPSIFNIKMAHNETTASNVTSAKPGSEAPIEVTEQIGLKDAAAKKQDETITSPKKVAANPKELALNQATDKKTVVEKAVVDKAAAEKAAAEKAAIEKVIKTTIEKAAENKTAAEKATFEKTAAEKVAAEKAAAEKAAAEKAAAEKAAAEKAASEKAVAEKAAAEKAAAEKASAVEKLKKEKNQPKKTVSEKPAPAQQAKKPETITKPSAKKSNYAAQVGMFSLNANVDNIVAKLKGAGYNNVIIKEEQRSKGTLYRVLVGPYKDSVSTVDIVNKLKTNGIDSYIFRY